MSSDRGSDVFFNHFLDNRITLVSAALLLTPGRQAKAHCYYTIVRISWTRRRRCRSRSSTPCCKLSMLFALYQVQRDLGDFICSGCLPE
jgi:hypothetical protein